MSAFAFKLDDIDEAGSTFAFPLVEPWLSGAREGSDLVARADGTLSANAHRSGREVVVRSLIRADLFVPCARCLEDVPVAVDLDVSTLFRPSLTRRESAEVESDDEDENVDIDYYDGDVVVLDGGVREHLLLEEPMQPLCRDDCPGIEVPAHVRAPASFGRPSASAAPPGGATPASSDATEEADAIDPRLAPLMKLRRKIAPTEE
jgi:uncharacterized protein